MTIESQMPELDGGLFCPPPPHKIGDQNTPYKLGLKLKKMIKVCESGKRKVVEASQHV